VKGADSRKLGPYGLSLLQAATLTNSSSKVLSLVLSLPGEDLKQRINPELSNAVSDASDLKGISLEGSTALTLAVLNKITDFVRSLIEYNADVNAETRDEITA
jgi:ankyrin repeat protein